jgi:hypothetical protein
VGDVLALQRHIWGCRRVGREVLLAALLGLRLLLLLLLLLMLLAEEQHIVWKKSRKRLSFNENYSEKW